MIPLFPDCRRRRSLGLALLVCLAAVSACDRPSQLAAPADGPRPQMNGAGTTTVKFLVFRAGGGAVANATISVYTSSTAAPTRLVTDNTGQATIDLPTGSTFGYLARVVPPEWLNFASFVAPPVTPGAIITPVPTDLGAVTCGPSGFLTFTRGRLTDCVQNLYVAATGTTKIVELVLPLLTTRSVTLSGLNGGPVDGNAFAYLITEVDPFPWQNLPTGVKQGLLLGYGPSGTTLPGVGGFIEAYGTSNDGFEIAGTATANGQSTINVPTSPVVCANDTDGFDYSLMRAPVPSKPLTFTEAYYAFAARRGTIAALDKDLTKTAVVVKFVQTGGPLTLNILQRHHQGGETRSAVASVKCTNGICDMANATITKTSPKNNPMLPFLYHPEAGKLIWVVRGIHPSAVSEWAAKACVGNGPCKDSEAELVDQLPVPDKSSVSRAYIVIHKNFTHCHPDRSFDGGWGIDI